MSATLLAVHLTGGFCVGVGYFSALWWAVRRVTGGRAGWVAAAAIIGRFASLAAVLALISREGGAPLLATAMGVIAGRFAVLRHVRRLPTHGLAA